MNNLHNTKQCQLYWRHRFACGFNISTHLDGWVLIDACPVCKCRIVETVLINGNNTIISDDIPDTEAIRNAYMD